MAQQTHIAVVNEVADVMLAAGLFDQPPTVTTSEAFFAREGHHLLIAYSGDKPVGFVTGVELLHPDKGAELLLYELGVDEDHRRQGIAKRLVLALADRGRERGCRGMWAPVEAGDQPAIATYRSAGGAGPDESALLWWDFSAS